MSVHSGSSEDNSQDDDNKTALTVKHMTWSMAAPATQTVLQLARLAQGVRSRPFPLVKRDIARILTAYSQTYTPSTSSSASIITPKSSCSAPSASFPQDDLPSCSSQHAPLKPAPPVLIATALDWVLRGSDSHPSPKTKEELLDACGSVLLEGFAAAVVAAPAVTDDSEVSDARKIGAGILSDALGNDGQVSISPRLFTRIAQSFDISVADLEKAFNESADRAGIHSSDGNSLLFQYVERLFTEGRVAAAAAMAVQFMVPRDLAEKIVKAAVTRKGKVPEHLAIALAQKYDRDFHEQLVQLYLSHGHSGSAHRAAVALGISDAVLKPLEDQENQLYSQKATVRVPESKTGKVAAEACLVMQTRGLARARRQAIENDRKLSSPLKLSTLLEKPFEDCTSVVTDYKSAQGAFGALNVAAIVGIDCEWASNNNEDKIPVALVQLATEDYVYILDVPALFGDVNARQTVKTGLEKVLNNVDIMIVGYQLSEDIRRAARAFQLEGVARNVLELGSIKSLPQGLSKISETVIGQPLAKAERLSDWQRRPLTSEQIEYAALDAIVLVEIARKLRLDNDKSRMIEIHLSHLMSPRQKKSSRKSKNSAKTEANSVLSDNSSLAQVAPAYKLIPPPEDSHSHAFLCDNTLGRLCRWLRVLGIDTEAATDPLDFFTALASRRIVLTRNKRLHMQIESQREREICVGAALKPGEFTTDHADFDRSVDAHGLRILRNDGTINECEGSGVSSLLIEADQPQEQLSLVIQALQLQPQKDRFLSRCAKCNGRIERHSRSHPLIVEDVVPARVLAAKVDEFWICVRCSKIFWFGPKSRRAVEYMMHNIEPIRKMREHTQDRLEP